MYIERHLSKQFLDASEHYPVIMVCGQRQVGKSTMLFHLKTQNRNYVSLDDMNARNLAKNDPQLFFETYGTPLLLDEFQRVPDILLEIKNIVDRNTLNNEPCNGMFWLTGSQKFEMMQDISESLAGRVAIFEMSSFSSAELDKKEFSLFDPSIDTLKKKVPSSNNLNNIFEKIFYGGMPKYVTEKLDRNRFFSDYVSTYIERDIKELSEIGKTDEFYQFLVYMAANTAQELKYDAISKEIGISAPTAKHWVTILEQSGIIFILRPFFKKITQRMVKTPKVYFMDTGLASYLTRWPDPETLENGNAAGAFFETFVVSELVKNYYNAGMNPEIFYYRDIDKKEIDVVIQKGRDLYPIEIKKGKNPKNPGKNFSVLKKLETEYNIKPGLIVCLSDQLIPYSKDIWYCPVSLLG